MNEIVYFELNNWFPGRDYPDAEPFATWMDDEVIDQYFLNKEWVKENKLVVAASNVDMSLNLCITAPKEWVKKNCPKLLSEETMETTFIVSSGDEEKEEVKTYDYKRFLRNPDNMGKVEGIFGCPFLPYTEENIGIQWFTDYYDGEFHDEYKPMTD